LDGKILSCTVELFRPEKRCLLPIHILVENGLNLDPGGKDVEDSLISQIGRLSFPSLKR
jgi:hypothetical protein